MIALVDKTKCTGCTACASACPEQCITMKTDEEGFVYPIVNDSQCIYCGNCKRVCPVEKQLGNPAPLYALGVIAKENNIRKKSSSGGVFYYLASQVLEQGGVVYGAAFQNRYMSVAHECIVHRGNIRKLMGSKYLQSDLDTIFITIKKQLEEGTTILFSGTPCQVSGLKSFLGKDYNNLVCVSVICHGVPSPLLWKKYVKHYLSKHHYPLTYCNFRSKKNGWRRFGIKMRTGQEKATFVSAQRDPYMRLFLKNMSLRPSCYQCHAKNNRCKADIVIGDFWGVEKQLPELADDKGTSLVLVYSAKGDILINSISNRFVCKKVSPENALLGNRAFSCSVTEPILREELFSDMKNMGFEQLAKKYVSINVKERIIILLDSMHLLELACRVLKK